MMKKRSILGIGLLFLSLAMAGCGKATTTKSANAQTTTTRTITADNGQVKVPLHPQRVVATVYTGEVMALGVNVVGSTSMDLANPFLNQRTVHKVKNLGNALNVEAVLKLKPDLIITSNEADVKALKKVAPVVYLKYGTKANVYQTLTKFGRILNRSTQAKKVATDLRTTSQKNVTKLKAAGINPNVTTVGFYEMQNNKLYVQGSSWGRGGEALISGLGFKLPTSIAKIQEGIGYKQISTESLPRYAADWMLFTSFSTAKKGNTQVINDLKNNVVWQTLPAVKAKHVIELPFSKMYYYDPAAVKGQIKMITNAMLAANK
ncbi:ABC transporter substrate-binding protein [Lapidilactobacillus bayanensis]|uniref:ABC transporter substrate-binding protein n=1 Tax=Lapidilactobacillus bayanensis TaxID=2485998 RepID=UPI000F767705|nr:ABC transporter substrate-binding protein [Lapidilactobacillus bayanensis]